MTIGEEHDKASEKIMGGRMDNKENKKFVDHNIKNGHHKDMFEDDED
jgi:hypothetical protein